MGKVCAAAEPHPVSSLIFRHRCLELLDLGDFCDPAPLPSAGIFPRPGLTLSQGKTFPRGGIQLAAHSQPQTGGNSGEGSVFPAPSFPGEPKGGSCSGCRWSGNVGAGADSFMPVKHLLSRSGGNFGSLGSEPGGSVPRHSPFPPYKLPSTQHPPLECETSAANSQENQNRGVVGIVAFPKGRYPEGPVTEGRVHGCLGMG